MRTLISRILPILAGALLALLGLPAAPAMAAVSCNFALGLLTVTITGDNVAASIARNGVNYEVNGGACPGGPTTANTTRIDVFDDSVAGDNRLDIDLSGGPFIGPDGEILWDVRMGNGTDDIFVLAGGAPAFVTLGDAGINLHGKGLFGDLDADVLYSGVEEFLVNGDFVNDFSDQFLAGGGEGTGGPLPFPVLLQPGGGNDRLQGGLGEDTLFGGDGDDIALGSPGADSHLGVERLEYRDSPAGVAVFLSGTTAFSGGDAEGDRAIGAVEVVGSSFDDVLIGNGANNEIEGRGGNDLIAGKAGADELDGGPGLNTLDYSTSTGAVTVDLPNCTATGGDATGDDLGGSPCDFVNVIGSNNPAGDTLIGDDRDNVLDGKNGPDTITGGDGEDTIYGRDGADVLKGGGKDDWIDGGRGADNIAGGNGNDTIIGGLGKDNLKGNAGNDTLFARDQEKDTVNGGDNFDSAQVDGLDVRISIEATIA